MLGVGVMIQIEASSRNLPEDMKYIRVIDAVFDFEVALSPELIDTKSRKYMEEIDGAVILDERLGTIRTPFGVTDLTKLSTGLKALLLVCIYKKRYQKFAINLVECGANVISIIFNEVNDTDIICVLPHTQFDRDLLCPYGCTVGGIYVEDKYALASEILKQR